MSLQHVDSLVVAQGLRISMAYGILVPSPGIEPVSSELQHRFLNTGLPGKYYTLSSVSFLPFFLSFFFFSPHCLLDGTYLTRQIELTFSTHGSLFCLYIFSSVQSLDYVQLFAIPWTAASQASKSVTNSQSLLKIVSIEPVMPSNHLILCRSLLLLPSIFSSIRVFSTESVLHIRWPKYWNFSFSISPSNEHSGLISFRIDWLDLFAVQGTLKSPWE